MTQDAHVPPLAFTSDDWDRLRFRFLDSMMVGTELTKLAQNIGRSWPIRGKDETPQKYTSLTLAELVDLPEFFGKSNRLPLLYSILQETLTFDEPFSAMAEHMETSGHPDGPALKSLQQLEIPVDWPISLAHFAPETVAFCSAEKIDDIGSLLQFSQKMAQTIIVGGDFRAFLNALSHLDMATLGRYLPIREGKQGLYLAEALALVGDQLEASEAAALLQAFDVPFTRPEWRQAKPLDRSVVEGLISNIQEHGAGLFLALPEQAEVLRVASADPVACQRYFAPLRDLDREALARSVALAALGNQPKFSLLKRLFSR